MSSPEICILLNAGSGKRESGTDATAIRKAFASRGAQISLKLIRKGTQLQAETRKAVTEGFKIIVAAGGDGTICAVAAALRGSKVTMGILPLGTFNFFARSLELPQDIDAAVQIILDGRAAPFRVASINGEVFLNNASLGAYPEILKTREEIYQRWGRSRPAAYWAVLKTLATIRPPLRLRIDIDGQSRDVRSPLVFIVNNAYQLQEMSLDGADRIEAGHLVLFIAPNSNRLGLFRRAVAVALGLASPQRDFELLSGRVIVIHSLDRPAGARRSIARDGEREQQCGPFTFKVVPEPLQVLGPPKQKTAAQ